MQGNAACAEGALARRVPVLRRLPDHAVDRDRRDHGPEAPKGRRGLHIHGGRTREHRRGDRRRLDRNKGHDRHERSGVLADDGEHRPTRP